MFLTDRRSALYPSLAVTAFVAAMNSPVFAASPCKGLEQDVCVTSDTCRWQAGYTRKDGIEVASHCRSSGKKKEAAPQEVPVAVPEAPTEGATEAAS